MRPALRQILLGGGGPWQTTASELRSQIAAYGAAFPGNSAIAPVYTATASATTTLTGSTVAMTDSRFLYRGGVMGQAGASFPDTLFWKARTVTYVPATPTFSGAFSVSFVVTGQLFEIFTKGLGANSKFRLKIDGLYDPGGVQNLLAADGFRYFIKVDLGTAATRTITLEANSGFYFGGIAQNTGETLSAPTSRRTLRLIAPGDSFFEATGTDLSQKGMVFCAGSLLGFDDIWASGSGGTGWVQTNGTRVALPDRWSADVLTKSPDVVIVGMGLNDLNDGNDGLIQQLATAKILELRRALPRCLIFQCGPWDVNAPSAPASGYAGIKAALQASVAGIPGCRFIDMQGVSYTKYTDNTHPDEAGQITLGTYPANQVKSFLGIA